MFYLTYMLSELRRRRGRTLLTALGLAVGVGLVVTVSALSDGLDRAQASVLEPLTGVGTDLSVSRPIRISSSGSGPGGFPLSRSERAQLERENGPARLGLRNLGKPGTHFTRDDFVATSQLSFPASEVARISRLAGVRSAAGGLTLTAVHVEGTVPKQSAQPRGAFFGPSGTQAGPRNIDLSSRTVTGIDLDHPELGAISPGQIVAGRYLQSKSDVVLNISYARRQGLQIGDTVQLAGAKFTVVGLAKTPLGGQASDLYVSLARLQALSGRKGRVNSIQVRAESADRVAEVASEITSTFSGAQVTTAKELADRVAGSLVDAKNLAGKLGTALEVVGLLAGFLIASLLTLSSVTKRIRELGTLKALGWSQGRVVRQVTGEALLQGVLGAVLGIAVGIGGAALVTAFGPSLEATVAQAGQNVLAGPFGQGAITTGSTTVALDAPVSAALIALAAGLAVLGGLVAGAVGGLRAARLRPADALRHID